MRESLTHLLRSVDVPSPERAEALWTVYRSGGADAEAAFTTLLAWYGLSVYRRIWGFVRSDAAEDVFQDVLAKLHRDRRRLDSFDHALRWLRTVAVRQCVDAHRRAARRKVRERRTTRPAGEAPNGARVELQETMAVALAKLSPKHREAVALVFFEGMNKQDAANVLGINRDTLASQLNVALSRLQRLVPAPAVLAAGGAAAIPVELSARSPFPSAERLGDLVRLAFARAAASGSRLGNLAWVAVGLAAVGGVTLAAWPRPEPDLTPLNPVASQPPPAPVESVADRNLRVFRAEIEQPFLALVREYVPDREVSLLWVEVHDTRLRCGFALQLINLRSSVSWMQFTHNTASGQTQATWCDDFDDKSSENAIWHPYYLPALLKNPHLNAAIGLFNRLPRDDRTVAEGRRCGARLEDAISRLLGTWYAFGRLGRRCEVRLTPDKRVDFITDRDPGDTFDQLSAHLKSCWLDPAGRIQGLAARIRDRESDSGPMLVFRNGQRSVIVSDDGQRLDFPCLGEWWSRDSISELKK